METTVDFLNEHKWVFVTTNIETQQTDLLENHNFFKFKSGTDFYGAKGPGTKKGINVSYCDIKKTNFHGTLTDRQLDTLITEEPKLTEESKLTDPEFVKIERLLNKGGKRKSKKNKSKKSRKSKKNKTKKSRKSKKNKSKSYKK